MSASDHFAAAPGTPYLRASRCCLQVLARYALVSGAPLLLFFTGPASAKETTPSRDEGEWIYNIQPGDTLLQIAQRQLANADAWKQLQKLNKISDPRKLIAGRTLRIPDSLSGPDLAQAEAVLVKGQVTVSRGDGAPAVPLQSGDLLRVGSTIETTDNGLLTLRFADQSRMLVSPNSRLTLNQLQFKRSSDEGIMHATLKDGSVESQVNPLKGTGARYEIKTPSLNLAVRGTTFRVQLDGKTGLTRSSVLEGAVKATNAKGEVNIPAGFGSVATPGKAPGSPRALLPPPTLAGGGTPIDYFPTRFDWKELKDARQYRVEIVSMGGEQRLVQAVTTRDPRSAWTSLPNGDYRIRVRGVDDRGLEGQDGIFDFKVAAWPAAPMIHAPLDGATLSGEKIGFRWARVAAADFLRFQVARDKEFKDIVMQVRSLTARSAGMVVPLQPGRYYWRVGSVKKSEGAGPFGPVQAFDVVEASGSKTPHLLRWHTATPGERYKIQVATHESFAQPLVDAEQATAEVQLPEIAQTIYVRMKRIAADGFPGDFEPVQTFEAGR